MNRDEAVRCSQIAQEHFRNGNYESAMKFFLKSYKLETSDETLTMIKRCEEFIKKGEGSSSSQSNNTHSSSSHQHQNNHSRSKSEHGTTATKSTAGTNAAITNEDIKKVLATKDFYEILGVAKTATDEEIKKSYRKLALKFHPDKNKEVGADEAFKKLAQAYDCLINPDKRQKYDEFGNEEPEQHYRHYRQYYDDDISAEDIFGMFFGNAFFQEGATRRRFANRQHRQQQHHHHHEHHQGNGQQRNQNKLLPFLQFLPLLIIIISSFALNFSQEEPLYSGVQTHKYSIHRQTQQLHVSYFVETSFESKVYQKDPRKFRALEENIEIEYVGKVRNKCATAQQKIRSLQNQASRAYYESDKQRYLEAATQVDYSMCEKFNEIQKKYPHLARQYYYY